MGKVIKFIPKNVIPMFETIELEPIVKFEFDSEFIDSSDSLQMKEFNEQYDKAEWLDIKTLLRSDLFHPSSD